MQNAGADFEEKMRYILLAEPLTLKGQNILTILGKNLTEDVFLEKVYVEPFTFYNRNQDEIINEKIESDYLEDLEYTQEVEKNYLIQSKLNFESRFDKLTDPLFMIKGEAGSGKTTYIHKLRELVSEKMYFHFCDFETTRRTISLLGIPFDFKEKFNSNVWKYVSIIVEHIIDILKIENAKDSQFHREFIYNITNIYKDNFCILQGKHTIVDTDDIRDFFILLGKYGESQIEYVEFAEELCNAFKNKFNQFESKHNHLGAVSYITTIMIRLFFCLFKITKKKQICVIDNIEYFVPFDEEHPIQECELQIIFDGIIKSISEIRPLLRELKNIHSNFENFYAFVLVTRPTSISLVESQHYVDFNKDSIINISTWYCAEDIYNNKIKFFKDEINNIQNSIYFETYANIIGDLSIYNWGLHDMISKMYNCNYRRIAEDVISAISKIPENYLNYFNNQWQISAKIPYLKHLCRKFIFRILINHIQRTKYFDKLMVEKRDATSRKKYLEDNESSSYARKIATTLYRVSINKSNNNDNDYVSFPEIIEAVLQVPYLPKTINGTVIEQLASILYLMNETRNEKTNWAPLITIKFDIEQTYNKKNLSEEMKKEWNIYKNSKDKRHPSFLKYGVKINSAGAFFAKMVPDFEYFACRYAPEYPALFILQNLRHSEKAKNSYDCIDLIKIVKENAFLCIDEVIGRDRNFFKSVVYDTKKTSNFEPLYNSTSPYKWLYKEKGRKNKLIPHPIRILNHHIGYIEHYLEYICNLPTESFEKNDDKDKIIRAIKNELYSYKNKRKDVIEKNRDYIRL